MDVGIGGETLSQFVGEQNVAQFRLTVSFPWTRKRSVDTFERSEIDVSSRKLVSLG